MWYEKHTANYLVCVPPGLEKYTHPVEVIKHTSGYATHVQTSKNKLGSTQNTYVEQ